MAHYQEKRLPLLLFTWMSKEEPEIHNRATSMNNDQDEELFAGQTDASKALIELLLKRNKIKRFHKYESSQGSGNGSWAHA